VSNLVGTIFVSIVTAALTTLVVEFGIRPLVDQRNLKGDIAAGLVMYRADYANPGYGSSEDITKAHGALRELASRLRASPEVIVGYAVWERLGVVVPRDALDAAATKLIGLSNGVFHKDVDMARRNMEADIEIRRLLGLDRWRQAANTDSRNSATPQ
jgi:hypothetical protein